MARTAAVPSEPHAQSFTHRSLVKYTFKGISIRINDREAQVDICKYRYGAAKRRCDFRCAWTAQPTTKDFGLLGCECPQADAAPNFASTFQ